MITNKDVRVENGNIVINGDKYPLDGQSPETIMEIVEDNSDTTPTENSTAPITSGGVYTAIGDVNTAINTAIGDVNTTIGDLTNTGVTGASAAAQIGVLGAGSVVRLAGVSTFDIVLSDVSYTAVVFGTISTTPISCIITAVADAQNPLAIVNLGTNITTEATVTFNESTRTVTITSTSNVYK